MSIRRVLLFLASVVLAAVLLVLLIRIGKVDVRFMLHQLERVTPINFIKLVLLNGLLVFLSTVKWRCVDAALRHPRDFVSSGIASFFVSSAGMALGLVLPVQFGMTIARTIGTHTYGRAVRRGAIGTLFEQGFDRVIWRVKQHCLPGRLIRYQKAVSHRDPTRARQYNHEEEYIRQVPVRLARPCDSRPSRSPTEEVASI